MMRRGWRTFEVDEVKLHHSYDLPTRQMATPCAQQNNTALAPRTFVGSLTDSSGSRASRCAGTALACSGFSTDPPPDRMMSMALTERDVTLIPAYI